MWRLLLRRQDQGVYEAILKLGVKVEILVKQSAKASNRAFGKLLIDRQDSLTLYCASIFCIQLKFQF